MESLRLSVVGAGAKAGVGPRKVQSAPTPRRWSALGVPGSKLDESSFVGRLRVARVARVTAAAGMYLRGNARLMNASLAGVIVPGFASLSGSLTSKRAPRS